jgi:hypothetical protein
MAIPQIDDDTIVGRRLFAVVVHDSLISASLAQTATSWQSA